MNHLKMQKIKTNKLKAFIFLLIISFAGFSQPGKDGTKTITLSNTIVNEFTKLNADANSGAVSLTVASSSLNANARFTSSLSAGDLILVIQMQGAVINGTLTGTSAVPVAAPLDSSWGKILDYKNCGLYEFAEVAGASNATTIDLKCLIRNNYSASGKTQIVRVPRYTTLTVNNIGELTSEVWNGQTGGILSVEVQQSALVNAGGVVNMTAKGFRGGIAVLTGGGQSQFVNIFASKLGLGANKGESIAGYQTDYNVYGGRYGRGAAANGGGGGNNHNCGGGGGANGGNINAWTGKGNPDISNPTWAQAWNLEYTGFSNASSSGGGRGGYSFSFSNPDPLTVGPGNSLWNGMFGNSRQNVGGNGGRPLDYSTGRIFLGGGGGAGHDNDNNSGGGGNGGGLIFITGNGSISGGGQIISNGEDGKGTTGDGIDGAGGGGGGGTIILNVNGSISGVSAIADGGKGGSQNVTIGLVNPSYIYEAEGPGAGGGGGYIATSNGAIVCTVNGGTNGVTNSPALVAFPPNGATQGGSGVITNSVISTFSIITSSVSICPGSSATLTAAFSGNVPAGSIISWYTDPSGNILVSTGSSYTTPPVTSATTFYIGTCPYSNLTAVTVYTNHVANIISPPPTHPCVWDLVMC